MNRLDPISPGDILAEEFMKPLSVSQNRLARDIDIPVSRVSDIVRGNRAITADTALRLAEYFGTSAELWIRLQSDYDLRVARPTVWPNIKPRIGFLIQGQAPLDLLALSRKRRDDVAAGAAPAPARSRLDNHPDLFWPRRWS